MRIGLFGGSFNPPHVCHQLATVVALECGPFDEVWWVPAYRHALGKDLAPFADRLAMCQLATAALGPRVRVREDEAQIFADGSPSHTLVLLHHLLRAAAGGASNSFRLLIGSDILRETAAWHRWDEVAALAPPWVIPRQDFIASDDATLSAHQGAPVALPAVASREIRSQLQASGRAAGLPHGVAAYIVQHGLYR
ncbi:MAG: nicotinate-nicotinamide nucleotide adenylyltransferase [Myxococcales bacterium]|nr:nicotinate-nicotinamide nucleotide adenylyltransferase [Myxococcales bacterium]